MPQCTAKVYAVVTQLGSWRFAPARWAVDLSEEGRQHTPAAITCENRIDALNSVPILVRRGTKLISSSLGILLAATPAKSWPFGVIRCPTIASPDRSSRIQ